MKSTELMEAMTDIRSGFLAEALAGEETGETAFTPEQTGGAKKRSWLVTALTAAACAGLVIGSVWLIAALSRKPETGVSFPDPAVSESEPRTSSAQSDSTVTTETQTETTGRTADTQETYSDTDETVRTGAASETAPAQTEADITVTQPAKTETGSRPASSEQTAGTVSDTGSTPSASVTTAAPEPLRFVYYDGRSYLPVTEHNTNTMFSDFIYLENAGDAKIRYTISDPERLQIEQVRRESEREFVCYYGSRLGDVTLTATASDGRTASLLIHVIYVEDFFADTTDFMESEWTP